MRRSILACSLLLCVLTLVGLPALAAAADNAPPPAGDWKTGLTNLNDFHLPPQAQELLAKNGFVVMPTNKADMSDLYAAAGRAGQPLFITTDAVLHSGHIFFDYLLRILEIDQLYAKAETLTDRMLELSKAQYAAIKDPELKEAARLNVGFFAVAKAQFAPGYLPGLGLDPLVKKELALMEAHKGLEVRPLLPFIKNPTLDTKPYAYEDYSQYVPRGHYTRNEQFQKYFKALMWFGRLHFDLETKAPNEDKRKMTLQALLMSDALGGDAESLRLWRQIYEPTVYFVGKADDLNVDEYVALEAKAFPGSGPERFADKARQAAFMEQAAKLHKPKILSGAGGVAGGNPGFRFMGQRFIPDSHMFQELVYGAAGLNGKKPMFHFSGSGKPITMEVLPYVGPTRALPTGLDIMAVLGSARALELMQKSQDASYSDYADQLAGLRKIYGATTPAEWRQNLYWRWFYALLPLLNAPKAKVAQPFMTPAWTDKNLQTALGSWAELRHDTILYAKQSYTGISKSMPFMKPDTPLGYVEPAPEVYGRLAEMFADLRKQLDSLGIANAEVQGKLNQYQQVLGRLKTISEEELAGKALTEEEYGYIERFDRIYSSLSSFSSQLMSRITSGTDSRMDLVADVHTDPNTGQVLEVAVGSPAHIFALVRDQAGYRICSGAVFTYHEFKQRMDARLTDEKWQQMGTENTRPKRPDWLRALGD